MRIAGAWVGVAIACAYGCSQQPAAAPNPAPPNVAGSSALPAPSQPSAPAPAGSGGLRAGTSQSMMEPPACPDDRADSSQPEAALRDTLERLEGSYPLTGDLDGPSWEFASTPVHRPFTGTLEITARPAAPVRPGGCTRGLEVPIAIALRTDDGLFDERAEGSAVLIDPDRTTNDGTPAPFLAEVTATLDAAALLERLTRAGHPRFTLGSLELRASVTTFGSRGMVLGSRTAVTERTDPAALAQPMLTWPSAPRDPNCVDPEDNEPLVLAETGAPDELRTAIERVAAGHYEARYADGATTTVNIRMEPPTAVCGANRLLLPTAARIATADGRLALRVPVALDPNYARLHWNARTDLPWAFPPSALASRELDIETDLSSFAHVGIEAWFDELPEPIGWVKVFGYHSGDCVACSEACVECSWERRIEALALAIGDVRL